VIGVVTSVPLVPRAPDQLPEAVQLVAFVVDQLSVEVPLLITAVGFAPIVTEGAGGMDGFGVEVALLPPPPPPPQPVARIPRSSALATGRSAFHRCCFICCCYLSSRKRQPTRFKRASHGCDDAAASQVLCSASSVGN
jgi:hypothetical protein